MKTFALFGALLFVATAILAADVNVAGNWSGTFVMSNSDGETHDSTALLKLKQDGKTITGTAGPNEDQQWPITTGKVEGDKITLEVQSDGPLLKFDLVLSGDHLKGDAHASQDGRNMSAKLDATRAK